MELQSRTFGSSLNDLLSSLRNLVTPETPETSPTDQLASDAAKATSPVDQGAALHELDQVTGNRARSDAIVADRQSARTGGGPSPTAPAAPTPTQTPAARVTVHRGQTLSGIARQHGVSLKALEAANPQIRNADSIRVGQTITIPARGAASPPAVRPASLGTPAASNASGTANQPGLDADHRQLAQILGVGEGNYESYNTGTYRVPGGRVGHSYLNPPAGTVTGQTINDVLNTASLPGTDTHRMFAVGAYQITIPTLRSAVTAMGLTGDEQLTPELQDRIFSEYLVPTAGNGALGHYITDGTGTVDQAQLAAAHQWASVAVPAGYRTQDGTVSDGTMTYYGGPANRANTHETQALRTFLQGLHQQ